MGLRRTECPGCAKRIYVVLSEGASATCPSCKRILELSPDGVRARPQAAEVSDPIPVTVIRPAEPVKKAAPGTAQQDHKPTPPPMPAGHRQYLAGGVVAVAVGIGIAAIAALALIVILSVGDRGVGQRVPAHAPELLNLEVGDDSQPAASRPRSKLPKGVPRAKATAAGVESRTEPPQQAPDGSARTKSGDPVRDALSSVALVACEDGNGSGFMAAPRLLVTNHHVIANARVADLRVTFPDNPATASKAFKASLVHEDERGDLAVLEIECDVPPLVIPAVYRHTNGQRVVAIGSPGTGGGDALRNLTTDGRLGPPYRVPDGDERWALAMPVNPGNSGGPVIDAVTGEVIGVVVAKFLRTESQGLAVPHAQLVEAVQRARAASASDRTKAESLHRQRYCLRHMLRMISMAYDSFRQSCAAAIEADRTSAASIREAFNVFKSEAADALTEEMVQFETVICPEIDLVAKDADCDPAVRVGLAKLRATIEGQAEDLRRSVAIEEIDGFVRQFHGSMVRGRALAIKVAETLRIDASTEKSE